MTKRPTTSQFIIYKTEDGKTKIDVQFDGKTVWLTQQTLAELFQTTKQNISQHILNIYNEDELQQNRTVKDFLTVRKEGGRKVSRELEYYNLDIIISVGYRIKSKIATAFRQWATNYLTEFIVKGFILDDERLKNPDLPYNYFEELTKRIQDIRTSEKRFYRKITDIYALSVDYDPTDKKSINFFKTVQNKLHWAITGKTAAEIINSRVDSNKANMGLTNYRGAKVRKQDVSIAKNYLNEEELDALNNLVEQYLIFAEGKAKRRAPMYMNDWIEKLHSFLDINDREILDNAGEISHKLAKETAETEYNKFNKKRIEIVDKQIVSLSETLYPKTADLSCSDLQL
ncbi:virulence RhuM family protein [Patescibacteria group bacterium]|nr:virulence RhuM family protein [Patescibacteria group bacterium]